MFFINSFGTLDLRKELGLLMDVKYYSWKEFLLMLNRSEID